MSLKKLQMDADNPIFEEMTSDEQSEIASIFDTPQIDDKQNQQSISEISLDNIRPSQHNRFEPYTGEKKQAMGCIWINVKCDPNLTYMWRSSYKSVVPAYHMNKYHWNSIILDGMVPDADIKNMIDDSFDLTKPKRTAKKYEGTD